MDTCSTSRKGRDQHIVEYSVPITGQSKRVPAMGKNLSRGDAGDHAG